MPENPRRAGLSRLPLNLRPESKGTTGQRPELKQQCANAHRLYEHNRLPAWAGADKKIPAGRCLPGEGA